MFSSLREYYLLEQDFKEVLSFIEPDDGENLKTYSHRLYGLLLRNCTAAEFHLKSLYITDGIPISKREDGTDKDLTMKDYFKVAKRRKLSDYAIKIPSWRSKANVIKPFEEWSGEKFVKLPWYDDYNKVKHNTQEEFKRANLKNVRDSLAAVFILLYSQYGECIFNPYQPNEFWTGDSDDYEYALYSLFAIKPPDTYQ